MNIELMLFITIFLFVFAAAAAIRVWVKTAQEKRCLDRYNSISDTGLLIPPTLHPVFDPTKCIGSGACTRACPQGTDVIGRIQGRGVLIDPPMCIGHGRCAAECPMGAIRLVFGTAERGVDIPQLSSTFETNIRGMYITGELGGMGLIANAVRQAKEGMENIVSSLKTVSPIPQDDSIVDVAIVGAGPAGVTGALAAIEKGLTYRLFDKEPSVGGAILQYPRNKIVMTHPIMLPLVGKINATTMSKEQLIHLLESVVSSFGIKLDGGVHVSHIQHNSDGTFTVHGAQTSVRARKVMLAIGRRGIPRKLGVSGEHQNHVSYSMAEPDPFIGRNVLVVGGGNSAVETACILARQKDTCVTLSYRKNTLSRVKPANRQLFEQLVSEQKLHPIFESQVVEIHSTHTTLLINGAEQNIKADAVIIQIGGELPTALLHQFGVSIQRHFGEELEQDRVAKTEAEVFSRIRSQQRSRGLQNFHTEKFTLPSWAKWAAFAFSAVVIALFFFIGREYYLLPDAVRRNDNALHVYSASGAYGHTLGIFAAILMAMNIIYFFRKEFRIMSGVGNIQTWIFFHQFSGILAAAMVILHTAFILYNAFALSLYISLAIVVWTGIVGRYFFAMVPIDPRGRPLTHEALVSLSDRMRRRFQQSFGKLNVTIEIDKILDMSYQPNLSWVLLLLRLFTIWPYRYFQLRRVFRHAKKEIQSTEAFASFKQYSVEMTRLHLQLEIAPRVKRVLGLWRSAHALLALMTVSLVVLHVIVEIWVGYGK